MITARVKKRDHGGPLPWAVTITYDGALHVCGARATHAAALAHALHEVGLTEKTRATQREEETAMSEDEMDRACEWSDYRKAYGVSSGAMTEAHKAFKAGWDAARGHSHEEGPTR